MGIFEALRYGGKGLKPFLFLPFAAGLGLFYAALSVEFEPALDPQEKELLAFRPVTVEIVEKEPAAAAAGDAKRPIEAPPPARRELARRPVAPKTTAGSGMPTAKASLILLKKDGNMTIINDTVLREGDSFAGALVLKIERDRVLLRKKTGEEIWLKIE